VWSPEVDEHIAAKYSADDLTGKSACKAALQREMGLAAEAERPLLGVVARMTDQKGVDLIAGVAPDLLGRGMQLAVLGAGERHFEDAFRRLQADHPGRMGLVVGFDEPLAHRIEAGADVFLMPSAFEPSGLNQLYSLRYGTPPVVRATGGLADTVTDTNAETLAAGTATGLSFKAHSESALRETVDRAVALWRDHRETWRQVMRTGMRQDWSWDRSAAEYERLYRLMCAPRALLSEQVGW
jgi:starch synthase